MSVMHVQKNVRSMLVTWNTANSVPKYAADVQRNVVEFRDKQQKCILRSSANTVLKEKSKVNTSLMERLSIGNYGRKKELHAEVKLYGVIFEVDEALKFPEYSLEMLLLQEVKRTYHTSKKSQHWFFKAQAV